MKTKTIYIILAVIVIAFIGYYLINSTSPSPSFVPNEYQVKFSLSASDEDISDWAQTNNVTLTEKIFSVDDNIGGSLWLIYSPDDHRPPVHGIVERITRTIRIDLLD